MDVICVEAGPIMTNCYVVADEKTNSAFIVDCALDSAEALFDILNNKKLKLEFVILTHTHWDHAGDAHIFHSKTSAPVYVHKDDEFRLLDPNEHIVFPIPWELKSFKPQKLLTDSDKIQFHGYELDIIHTPGHTEGSISILNQNENILFSGDTLFNQSIGRTDLPGGDTNTIMQSLFDKLMVLDDEIKVYSGHGPMTTIGHERANNPFILNKLS